MSNRKLAAVILFVVVLVAGFSYILLTVKPTSTPTLTPTPTSTPATPPPRGRPALPPMIEAKSIDEASATVGFKIPTATYLPGNPPLQRILIQPNEVVYLLYAHEPIAVSDLSTVPRIDFGATDLMFIISLRDEVDPEIWIESHLEMARVPGWRIEINGHPGYVGDPGTDPLTKSHVNGRLQFYTETYDIQIYGDYPASELIKVAESMPLIE